MAFRIKLADGKYELVHEESGKFYCLRHGEPWQDLVGNNMLMALAQDFEDLRQAVKAMNDVIPLSDLIYSVRENEGEGWEGEKVTTWSNACDEIRRILP